MQATRFERKMLTSFFVAGWLALFSAAIAHAQLHGRPPPTKPTFNPSTPYTLPQKPQTPVSPGLANAHRSHNKPR